MTNALYKVTPGATQAPLASDLNQYFDALNGNFDIGQINLATQISPPSTTGVTATAATGTALGVGAYLYKFTYVVGYKKSDQPGTIVYGNETNGSASVSVTTTANNQAVSLAGLPTTWPSTAIALRIYRTAVGGADGTQKLVYTMTTPTATYIDTTADGSLGAAILTTNTTGTKLNGYVDTTTNQTVGGNKTFNNGISIANTGGADTSFGSVNYNAPLGASWNNQNLGGTQYQVNAIQEASDRIVASTTSGSVLTNFIRQWYSYAKAAAVLAVDFVTGKVSTLNNVIDDGSGNSYSSGSVTSGAGMGTSASSGVTSLGANKAGIYFGWNYQSGTGEGDIFVYGQGGAGGLNIYNTTQTSYPTWNKIFSIDSGGGIIAGSTINSIAGASGGTMYWTMSMRGSLKILTIYLNAFNTNGTYQTFNLPTGFQYGAILSSSLGDTSVNYEYSTNSGSTWTTSNLPSVPQNAAINAALNAFGINIAAASGAKTGALIIEGI